MFTFKTFTFVFAVFFALNALHSTVARADEPSWFDEWLKRVGVIQSEQPRWMTPLVTVTPRLEQEFRTDFVAEYSPKGHELSNFGNGKGLELIPFENLEVVFDVPPYLEHNNPKVEDGFGDFAMLIKYRLLSANEDNGDYIVTAFLGVSFPTGTATNGSTTSIFTPSLSAGKGFLGLIDVQTTLGYTLPAENAGVLGHTLTWNTALQAHYEPFFVWPEVEDNFSSFNGGANDGLSQNYITPGVMFGRFPLHERTAISAGLGYQVATSDYRPYQHAWILSTRLPF